MDFFNQLFAPARHFEIKYAQSLLDRFRFARWPDGIQIDIEQQFVPLRELDLALEGRSRVLLTGAAGTGKTTALAHLALKHARALASEQHHALVPIYFSGHDLYPESSPRLSELARSLGLPSSPSDYFLNAMQAGRLLLLVDDLDALPPHALDELRREFSSARIVASSQEAIADWFEFHLPAWRDQDIDKFARLRFNEQANAFLAALKASGVPRALSSNPFTLSLLAYAWESPAPAATPPTQLHDALDIKPLPSRRTELFDIFSKSVIGNDDETRRMLEGVALAIQRKKPARDEWVAKSRGFLASAPNQTCAFVHDLWRAYFAARAARLAPDLSPIEEHLDNPAWRDLVLFYAGLGDATELVSALVAGGDLIFAGYAIAHAQEMSVELKESVTKELLGLAWDGDAQAAAALGEMQSDAALSALAAKLKDPDPSIRARAAEVLGLLQMDRALEYLLPQMRDVNAETRDKVIEALGRSLSNRVIEPLLVALRGDPRVGFVDTRLRVAAANALGEVGSDKAVPALIVDLQTGEPQVRPAVAHALKRIASPFMVKPLKGVLLAADEETRRYAAEILASMNGEAS